MGKKAYAVSDTFLAYDLSPLMGSSLLYLGLQQNQFNLQLSVIYGWYRMREKAKKKPHFFHI